jgi:superkiller protein 3
MRKAACLMAILAICLGCGGDSAEKYMQEGFISFQSQKYDQAIASYEKAIQLDPKAAAAHNMLGMACRFKYSQLGNPEYRDKEVAAFKKAIEIDPKFWVAMINLGTTYYAMGQGAQAAPLFRQALALNPNHPEKAEIEKMIVQGEKQP